MQPVIQMTGDGKALLPKKKEESTGNNACFIVMALLAVASIGMSVAALIVSVNTSNSLESGSGS